MITFGFQQSLPTPKLSMNVVFYKRQTWIYNLGILNCSTGKAVMYMWPECVASRGSMEIVSCLAKHLKGPLVQRL